MMYSENSIRQDTARRNEPATPGSEGVAAASGGGSAQSAHEPSYWSAVELLRMFRARQLSPVEVLKAQIRRYEAIGGQVNCVTYTHYDTAMRAAEEAERRYRQGNPRPLEGLTVAVQDKDGLAGWTVTAGSVLLKDCKLERNTPVADQLMQAGAILHLQTTVPEFYALGSTWSKLWGVTRNPWNLHFTVGGSPGGAGAAVAAGLATLAADSGMDGSIQLAAGLNGVYGFRPSRGRVPAPPGAETIPQETLGLLARTLDDLALSRTAFCGRHLEQPGVLSSKGDCFANYPDIKGWHIAYSPNQGWAAIDPEVKRNTATALGWLERQGAIVEPVTVDWSISEIFASLVKALLAAGLGKLVKPFMEPGKVECMTSYGRYLIKLAAREDGPRQLAEARAYAAALLSEYDDLCARGFRAFVCPTAATSRVPADLDPTDVNAKLVVNGQPMNPLTGWSLTLPFSLMDSIPVVNVPTGLDSNDVPTGMQIAARSYDDSAALQVAAAYARAARPLFAGDRYPHFRGG